MDNEAQKDEIMVLESIYNEGEFSYKEENGQYQCDFRIFMPSSDYCITYKDTRHTEEPLQKTKISYFPPLSLNVVLPNDYPSTSPPKFTLHSSWLHSQLLAELCKKLDQLWDENKGKEILFTWISFLHNEALEFLNIDETIDLSQIYTHYLEALEKSQSKNMIESPEKKQNINEEDNNVDAEVGKDISERPVEQNPVQALIDYNDEREQIEFKNNYYTCKICFENKVGKDCARFLPCNHVFCKNCIAGYLAVRITDGNVRNINCPEDKCPSEASPTMVKELVNPDLFAKYDSMLLNTALHTMSDITYCPRRICQYPVTYDPSEQMASCPLCQYTFCIYCRMVYHGIEACRIQSAEMRQLVKDYQEGSSETKHKLELRYGKKQIQTLVQNSMSENWLKSNSKKCPSCNIAIEKSTGCNKMVCTRCNTYFCWLCGAVLDRLSPYSHYQDSKSSCFNLLNHGIIDDDEDDEDYDEDLDDYEDDDGSIFSDSDYDYDIII